MKIAVISDVYYPMTNGVAVFSHNLANGLSKKGHEVIVICPSFQGKFYSEKLESGLTVTHLSSIRFPFYPDQINEVPEKSELFGLPMPRLAYRHGIWFSINPWFELKKVLREFSPDVIHLQTAETIAVATLRYVKKYNVPLVTTGHTYPDNITGQFKILKPIKKPLDKIMSAYMMSFLKHAEYATMPTELAINDLVPKNRKSFKVTVEAISNGVDLSSFVPGEMEEEIIEKYGLDKAKKRVLYVGRVDPEKSIHLVVKAFAKALNQMSNIELVIVGDGIDLENLKHLAKELGIEKNVKFLGRIMPPELIKIYRTGDVFATGSETETQGIVLIEAAAVGLPLIAVDVGAVGEICINQVNGELCEPKNIVQISKSMVKILTDEKLAKKYGKESIKLANKHDLNRTLDRFVEIYEEAINLKKQAIDKK